MRQRSRFRVSCVHLNIVYSKLYELITTGPLLGPLCVMAGQFSSQRSVIRYFCTAKLVKDSERVGFPRPFSSLFLRPKETNAVLSRESFSSCSRPRRGRLTSAQTRLNTELEDALGRYREFVVLDAKTALLHEEQKELFRKTPWMLRSYAGFDRLLGLLCS